MKIRPLFLLTTAVMALAACNSSEEAAPAPLEAVAAPEPVLTPAAIATAAPDGTALVQGAWSITEDAAGAVARFGIPETDSQLIISCAPATRAVTLALQSGTLQPQAWRLDAGGEAARIDMASEAASVPPYLVAQVDQTLAIIVALGEQGQVFTLTSPTGDRNQFPTHPGIRRVIDSCS